MIFMIAVELSNKKALNKSLRIDLPISSDELKDTLAELNAINISHCDINCAFADNNELDDLFGCVDLNIENFQKLNVLAFLTQRLVGYHDEIFSALLYKDDPETLDEIIITAHDARTGILWDALNKNDLGLELIEAEYVDVSEELYPLFNYKKLAQLYLEDTDTALTPYGFVGRLDDDRPPCCPECRAKEIIEDTLEEMEQENICIIFFA